MHRAPFAFAAACAGMLLFGIVFLSLGSVNNMLAERFQLDNNAIGTLTALLPFGILAGSLLFGPVVDRFGYRWMLAAAALGVGAGLEGLAFADRPALVQFFVFLIGLGGGVLNGATNALAADLSPGARGPRLSLLGVFFGIGAMTMPGLLALLSRHFPLPVVVSAIGLVTLVPAAWFLLVRFPPPKQRNEPYAIGQSVVLLRDPVVLLAGLALAVQSGMEGMSNDWMTRYFKHVTLAGQAAEEWRTQLGLLAVTGAMVGTRLVLSRLLTRVPPPAVLFASVGVTALGALTLMQSPGYAASLGAALCLGAGLAAAFPVVLGYIGDRYPSRSGAAFSTLFFVALLGNMAINKTFGALAQMHGVGQYARVMLACLVVSAILLGLVVARLPGPHAPSKEGPA